jgi:hypothetical protein
MRPTTRKGLYLAATVGVALLVIFAAILLSDSKRPAGPSYLQLAAINVAFSGSGAANASAYQVCLGCPQMVAVGQTVGEFFEVNVPFSSTCSEYSISQIEGPTTGAFVVTNASASIGSEKGLPLFFPYCQGGGDWLGRANIYFDVSVYDTGPSSQTLPLTVVINQNP